MIKLIGKQSLVKVEPGYAQEHTRHYKILYHFKNNAPC